MSSQTSDRQPRFGDAVLVEVAEDVVIATVVRLNPQHAEVLVRDDAGQSWWVQTSDAEVIDTALDAWNLPVGDNVTAGAARSLELVERVAGEPLPDLRTAVADAVDNTRQLPAADRVRAVSGVIKSAIRELNQAEAVTSGGR